jgi:signal transduction histidine kinase
MLQLRSGREIALCSFGPFTIYPVYFLFYEDENENLWFIMSDGKKSRDGDRIYRAETAGGRPVVIESFQSGISWGGDSVDSIANLRAITDRAGGLWLASTGVLARLWHGRFYRLQPADGLPETNPRCFFLDSRGWLWIGMRYGGVSMTKEPAAEAPHFINYSTEQGLASNAVRSIAEDDFDRLYLGTDKGLHQFDPINNQWRHYTRKDGLAGDDVRHLYKDRTGNIWVSTSLGISRLDPRAERGHSDQAPIYLIRVNVAGEDLRLPETGALSIPELELSASRNNLLVEFVGLSFQGEQKLRYQYKLEGVDADWGAPTEARSVNYARLASGSYQFLARAINEEGIASSEPARLRLRILPPIWQRWWFIGSGALLVGLMAYSLYRLRLAQLIELERVRTRIATDLHDDIGSSLSRMAILSEVVKRQPGSPAESDPMLTEIADSARGLIGSMRDIVWSIDPRRDDLDSLIFRVRQFASDVLEPKGVKWDLDIPSHPRGIKLGPDERRHLFLIFKEAINNIARHAECSSVSVSIAIDRSDLRAAVRDDGRGFTPARDESFATNGIEGHGLSNMRSRAQQLGGALTVHSVPGTGTRLDLTIPLKGL